MKKRIIQSNVYYVGAKRISKGSITAHIEKHNPDGRIYVVKSSNQQFICDETNIFANPILACLAFIKMKAFSLMSSVKNIYNSIIK